jgi:hypothetical protein
MACWDGYVQKGMKKKNGRMVPNCVPSMKQGGLTKWFQEKWVDIGAPKKNGQYQACGRSNSSKRKYPKCVPLAKATADVKARKRRVLSNENDKPQTLALTQVLLRPLLRRVRVV